MPTPLLHPATQKLLEATARHLPQALLLSGENGVGLHTIASWLAGKSIAAALRPQDKKGSTDSENGTISVEMIRGLYEQTRAKYAARRVIIIDDADRMSRGAQNAFLKLLEEPSEHAYFILTAHRPQLLLPTVRSRTQHVTVHPVTDTQTAEFIATLGTFDTVKTSQLQFIANGLPAELARLANSETFFQARARIISDARDFLQGSTYEKLLVIQKYKTDRPGALQLCDSALHILRRSLSKNPQPALISQLDQLLSAKEQVTGNRNITLQLTRLVL